MKIFVSWLNYAFVSIFLVVCLFFNLPKHSLVFSFGIYLEQITIYHVIFISVFPQDLNWWNYLSRINELLFSQGSIFKRHCILTRRIVCEANSVALPVCKWEIFMSKHSHFKFTDTAKFFYRFLSNTLSLRLTTGAVRRTRSLLNHEKSKCALRLYILHQKRRNIMAN